MIDAAVAATAAAREANSPTAAGPIPPAPLATANADAMAAAADAMAAATRAKVIA